MNSESFNDCVNECKKKYEKLSRDQLIEKIIKIDKSANPIYLNGENTTDKGLLIMLCTLICQNN